MSKNSRNLAEENDMEILREKYKNKEKTVHWYDINQIKDWLKTISDKGEFPDIDYKDFSAENFSLGRHLYYICRMARAYTNPNCEFFESKELKKKIDICIKNWTDNHYQCTNWWNNQIQTPEYMIRLLYMLDDYLTKDQIKAMLEVSDDANFEGSGARPSADRVRIAEIYLENALFRRDEKDVEFVLEIIEDDIHFAGEGHVEQKEAYFDAAPGLERDYCFHHRTDGVDNTLDYGIGQIVHYMSVATMVSDTKYRFKDEPTKILVDFFLEGICKHMVYCSYNPEGILNRDIAREKSENREGNELVNQLLQMCNGYRKDELENVIAMRNGDYLEHPEIIPSYAYYFWKAELFTFQRPGLYSAVRMYSNRMYNIEYPMNGEGILNQFRGDGTNYIQVTGTEYINIAPVFDFRKVPGATILQVKDMPHEVHLQGLNNFTGGVTDNLYGAAAFDFISPHYDLKAKKSWFYFEKEYVCLGTKINSKENFEIFTTLEQNYHQGGAYVQYEDNNKNVEEIIKLGGEKNFTKAQWVHHGLVGYYFLDKAKIGIKNMEMTGNWTRLNKQGVASKDQVKKHVFTLWINHGKKIENGTYAYAILPNATVGETKNYKNLIEIVSNNENLQAVRHKNMEISYGVFYEKGKIKLTSGIEISTNTSCMLMIKEEKGKIKQLSLSDPNKRELGINLKIKGKFESQEKIVKYRYDKENDLTNANFSFPQGDYLGQSINIDNEYLEKSENKIDNWWIVIAIIGVLFLIRSLFLLFCKRRKKNTDDDDTKNIENNLKKEGLFEEK